MKKKTQIFILLFLFLLYGCSYEQPYNSDSIMDGWKSEKVNSISFSIPSSMQEKSVQGIDTAVWKFENSDISISIESGIYTNIPEYVLELAEYDEPFVNMNGIRGRIVSYKDFNQQTNSDQFHLLFNFNNTYFSSSNILFEAEYKEKESKEVILSIFNSIKID